MVNGLAYRLLGRDEELDDLVQDAFLAAFRALDRLEQPQAFGSWLSSIVVRSAHKLIRRRRMLGRLGLRRPVEIEPDRLVGQSTPPQAAAELSEIYRGLERLHPEARVALVLHRVEGMSIPEVAEQMGLSSSTVKRRLKLAERHLSLRGASEERES